MDGAKANEILEAAKHSMGMDISDIDLLNIHAFAERVIKLAEYRKGLQEYLHNKMNAVAPNLQALIGDQVGARLISHAGSLTNLSKYPASTVQILGAEKALFRALKAKHDTPKYGLIYHASLVGQVCIHIYSSMSRGPRMSISISPPTPRSRGRRRPSTRARSRACSPPSAPSRSAWTRWATRAR